MFFIINFHENETYKFAYKYKCKTELALQKTLYTVYLIVVYKVVDWTQYKFEHIDKKAFQQKSSLEVLLEQLNVHFDREDPRVCLQQFQGLCHL